MNLFTQNIPYYHLLKYLLFLLKHHVYESHKIYLSTEPRRVQKYVNAYIFVLILSNHWNDTSTTPIHVYFTPVFISESCGRETKLFA